MFCLILIKYSISTPVIFKTFFLPVRQELPVQGNVVLHVGMPGDSRAWHQDF